MLFSTSSAATKYPNSSSYVNLLIGSFTMYASQSAVILFCDNSLTVVLNLLAIFHSVSPSDTYIVLYSTSLCDNVALLINKVIAKAIPNIIEASLKVNAKRIIDIGGAGTLETNGIRNMDAPGFPEAFVIPSKATEMVRNLLINENKISTTILCPSLNLFEGSRTGNYRINDNNQTIFNSNNNSEISTSDLAVALIDEVFNQKYLNKVITAGY